MKTKNIRVSIKLLFAAFCILLLSALPFNASDAKAGEIALIEGVKAPVFKGTDFNDKPFDLSLYYKKKPVVINFFSVRCVSCLAVVTFLEEYREKNKITDEIAFVYINLDNWRGQKSVNVPTIWHEVFSKNQLRIKDGKRLIGKLYQVETLPSTVIIGTDGNIFYRRDDYTLGFKKEIKSTLGTLLKK